MATIIRLGNEFPMNFGIYSCKYFAMKIARIDSIKSPFTFEELKLKVGQDPAYLLLSLQALNPRLSKPAFLATVRIISHLSNYKDIRIDRADLDRRTFYATYHTRNTSIADALGESGYECKLIFKPEHRVYKNELRGDLKSHYDLDLVIELQVSVEEGSRHYKTIATVIVEYDGPVHLGDAKVRDDKIRDSLIQSSGSTVFRIQEPSFSTADRISASEKRDKIEKLTRDHAYDVENHLRNKLVQWLEDRSV